MLITFKAHRFLQNKGLTNKLVVNEAAEIFSCYPTTIESTGEVFCLLTSLYCSS